jgi:hypothetical protein
MNRRMNFALAASMLALTLAAVPQNASAATEIYLQLDGIKGEDAKTTVQAISPLLSVILALIG